MRNARHATDYHYDFGIWQSTKKIRELLTDVTVPPEVHLLLNHIDGMTAEHMDAADKLRRKARPAEELKQLGRDLIRHNVYR